MSTLTTDYLARPAVAGGMTRYQVLIGALLIQLILGTVYGYSIFWEPLDSAVWPAVLTEAQAAAQAAAPVGAVIVANEAALKRERAVRQKYLTYAFSICLLAFSTTMIFAGRLQDIIGPRATAAIGGVLMAAGFLVAGQMSHRITFLLCHALLIGGMVMAGLLLFHAVAARLDREQYPLVQYIPHGLVTVAIIAGVLLGNDYVSQGPRDRLFLLWATIGLLAGVGIGFAYVCPIAALVKWFPQHKGLMSGIAVAGFGFGAYIFSHKSAIGATNYIAAHGITALFNVHALICLVAIGLGALLLRNPPAGYGAPVVKGAAVTGRDLTWQETLRTGRFYLIWLMFFSGSMAGLMVIGILKPFAGGQLVAAAERAGGPLSEAMRAELLYQGATAVGILSIFNAIGRVFWGLVSDRIGRRAALMLMYALQGMTLLSLSALDTRLLLAVGAACVGFNYGGCFALFPSLTADLFGSKNLGANYGWVFTSYGIAGVAGVWAGGTALVMTGSYFAAFAVAASLCFASAALGLLIKPANAAAPT